MNALIVSTLALALILVLVHAWRASTGATGASDAVLAARLPGGLVLALMLSALYWTWL